MRVQEIFPVVIATGFHLFPFRTEKLSPTAPMVLHTRGRVGRRHFTRQASRLERDSGLCCVYTVGDKVRWGRRGAPLGRKDSSDEEEDVSACVSREKRGF